MDPYKRGYDLVKPCNNHLYVTLSESLYERSQENRNNKSGSKNVLLYFQIVVFL